MALADFYVLWSVVGSVPVLVVDDLFIAEWPPDEPLSYDPMLPDFFSVEA